MQFSFEFQKMLFVNSFKKNIQVDIMYTSIQIKKKTGNGIMYSFMRNNFNIKPIT